MKISFLKMSFALAILSLYIFFFSVMETIGSSAEEGFFSNENGVFATGGVNTTAPSVFTPESRRIPGLADYKNPILQGDGEIETETEDVVTISETTVLEISASQSTANNLTQSAVATTASTAKINTTATNPASTTVATTKTTPSVTTATTATTASQKTESGERFKIRSGGVEVEGDARDIVARVVQGEIGSSFHEEAVKAQAIAVYTYIKRENGYGSAPTLPLATVATDRIAKICGEVFGRAIYYDGDLINAVFCASTSGYSSSAKNVWGKDVPYLRSVVCEFDNKYDPNMGRTIEFTSEEIRSNVQKATGIQLTGNPANWLQIHSRVDTVYVGDMSIGGKTSYTEDGETIPITGRKFREKVMSYSIRSANFEVSYDSGTDKFTFVTNGYGHGLGLSQNGANILATHYGYNHVDILKKYYTGVSVY
jgi:stage II sporulation protein D